MIATGLFSLYLRLRGRLYETRAMHRLALAMGPTGFVAILAGWVTTEVGRQPYLVYGLMHRTEGLSPIAAPAVAASLAAFVIVYLAVFGAGIWYLLHLMRQPVPTEVKPLEPSESPPPALAGRDFEGAAP